jgi:hypothetical protein
MPDVFHGTNHSIAPGFAGGPGKFGWNVTPYRNEPPGKAGGYYINRKRRETHENR